MSGRIVDLAEPGSQLPAMIAVDTNIIMTQFLAFFRRPTPQEAWRASQFFRALRTTNAVGIITSTIVNEVFHFAIKGKYRTELPNHQTALATAYGPSRKYDWVDLYKIDPSILQRFSADLDQLREILSLSGLLFLQPDDLGPVPFGQTMESEMVRLIRRYGMDTTDTAILLEARRAGVFSIASFDADMQRAAIDFDVYTWHPSSPRPSKP